MPLWLRIQVRRGIELSNPHESVLSLGGRWSHRGQPPRGYQQRRQTSCSSRSKGEPSRLGKRILRMRIQLVGSNHSPGIILFPASLDNPLQSLGVLGHLAQVEIELLHTELSHEAIILKNHALLGPGTKHTSLPVDRRGPRPEGSTPRRALAPPPIASKAQDELRSKRTPANLMRERSQNWNLMQLLQLCYC